MTDTLTTDKITFYENGTRSLCAWGEWTSPRAAYEARPQYWADVPETFSAAVTFLHAGECYSTYAACFPDLAQDLKTRFDREHKLECRQA